MRMQIDRRVFKKYFGDSWGTIISAEEAKNPVLIYKEDFREIESILSKYSIDMVDQKIKNTLIFAISRLRQNIKTTIGDREVTIFKDWCDNKAFSDNDYRENKAAITKVKDYQRFKEIYPEQDLKLKSVLPKKIIVNIDSSFIIEIDAHKEWGMIQSMVQRHFDSIYCDYKELIYADQNLNDANGKTDEYESKRSDVISREKGRIAKCLNSFLKNYTELTTDGPLYRMIGHCFIWSNIKLNTKAVDNEGDLNKLDQLGELFDKRRVYNAVNNLINNVKASENP